MAPKRPCSGVSFIPATASMLLVEVSEGKRASNKKWDFFNKWKDGQGSVTLRGCRHEKI